MPLDIALGSMLFYHLHNDCVTNLKDFILKEVEQSEQAKQILKKNGAGINHFTQQLEETFSTLKRLNDYQSNN